LRSIGISWWKNFALWRFATEILTRYVFYKFVLVGYTNNGIKGTDLGVVGFVEVFVVGGFSTTFIHIVGSL